VLAILKSFVKTFILYFFLGFYRKKRASLQWDSANVPLSH